MRFRRQSADQDRLHAVEEESHVIYAGESHDGFGGQPGGDIASELINYYGSNSANTFRFNSNDNIMFGRGGDDVLYGEGGDDIIYGGVVPGTDSGDDGVDWLFGDVGNDHLFGEFNNDLLDGGVGADRLDGGLGQDIASYVNSSGGVWVDLSVGAGLGGEAQHDTLISIENLRGSAFGDALVGDNGANYLEGNGGNDLLIGGRGNDRLFGGSGADIFQWVSRADTGHALSAADFVTDFDRSEGDLLDLSAIDANVRLPGNQTFEFIEQQGFTAPGQVRWFVRDNRTFIELSTDTDGAREMIIEVAGLPLVQEDWFIL